MTRVAVAARSFSRHPRLRAELTATYADAKFSESPGVLHGDALAAFLRGYDAAIVGLEPIDEAVLSQVPELRVISKYGVGLDMIDLDAARRHGVTVRWTPGVNRQAVAELTICFMIALCRSVVPLAHELADGGWRHPGGRQISSSTVGVLGCGQLRTDSQQEPAPCLRRVLGKVRAGRAFGPAPR